MTTASTARLGQWGPVRPVRGDLLAGVTVTAYLVPQVMAYADLAGVPAQAGLWAAIGAMTVYAAIGTSPQLSVGPEATTALMTAAAIGTAVAGPDEVPALALLVAVVCIAGRLLGLARLAELLSRPVLVGYMTGIALVMIVSQLGKLTGARVPAGESHLEQVWWLLRHPSGVHVTTLVLGTATLSLMLVASRWWPRAPVALLGMVGASLTVAAAGLTEHGILLVGDIPAGVPDVALPSLAFADLEALVPAALAVAFVGFSDNILTARAFATRHGTRIDSRRELVALGGANLGAALLQGMPVSSSGSRTAICDAVGGRTRAAGLMTAIATTVAVLFMGPALEHFPTPALGAVVVYAAVRLIDVGEFRRIAAFRRSELLITVATAVSVVVVGVLQGVLIAVGLSILDLLRRVARPHDAIEGYVPGIAGMHDVDDFPNSSVVPGLLVYRYDSPLFFANAADFTTRSLAAVDGATHPIRWFVLNTEAIVEVDLTAVDALEDLRSELQRRGIVVALARVKQDLLETLRGSVFLERVGVDHVFPTLPTAVEAYLADVDRTGDEGPPIAGRAPQD